MLRRNTQLAILFHEQYCYLMISKKFDYPRQKDMLKQKNALKNLTPIFAARKADVLY